MRSYKPQELFDEHGQLLPELFELAPEGDRRMGSNPHANGGNLLRDLKLPDFREYAVSVPAPAAVEAGNVHILGSFLRDVVKLNADPRNFRIFGPRRDGLQPPRSRVRGDRSPVGCRDRRQ